MTLARYVEQAVVVGFPGVLRSWAGVRGAVELLAARFNAHWVPVSRENAATLWWR